MTTVKYLRDQRHVGTVAEVIKLKFPFPNEQFPDLEAVSNVPSKGMAVGQEQGHEYYPNIVVVRRPGTWIQMMAEVEMHETLTDEAALTRWKPYSECGDFYLYVPFGLAGEAKKLCKKHGIHLAGIRVWRFRPVWGLDVAGGG